VKVENVFNACAVQCILIVMSMVMQHSFLNFLLTY
jgi:hypothetical protein